MTGHPPLEQPCAGAIIFDPDGRLLLIRRGRPPSMGSWSVPGGRCRPGEPRPDACVREVAEETGLHVRVVRWAGRVRRDAPDGGVYVIDDYVCEVLGGDLRAGDDALDVAWFTPAELAGVAVVPGLLEALAEWAVLPDVR